MAGQDESHTNLANSQITMRDAVPLARGTVLAGRYEVETTLGRGGAGVVLRAFDRELSEAVAIKVLHPELSQETRWIERLAREVKLARQLRHPNVCRVFDFEKADGHVFIVMELATGGSLRQELHDQAAAPRSPDDRLVDARAVAEGLAAIHQAGIAHRDVTPQNVLRMADGRLVVSDFGLATEISQTTASIHGGTIAYMAPEVVRGQRADFAADVWSLGVVIHEIMFGARPTWSKASGGAMLTPVTGRTLAKGERLAYDVCRACTSERPGDRPASAGAVAAWLGGRRQKSRHRAPRWIALALLAAVALAGGARLRWAWRNGASSATLEPTGEPADWTELSKVLATVDGNIKCLTSLPGTETIRFAREGDNQPEDLDLGNLQRRPSALVPEARKEGCAQASPDGKRLAFQGYVADGRAFAFVSDRQDGGNATAVVPIADPSIRSDPGWLSNKDFAIDIDNQHAGVFSLDTHRVRVLPVVSSGSPVSVFRSVSGSTVYMYATSGRPLTTEIAGFEWPLATEKHRFRVAGGIYEMASPDGRSFFMISVAGEEVQLWKAEPAKRSLRRLAEVRDQYLRLLTFTRNHLVFASRRDLIDAWRLFPDGRRVPLSQDGRTVDIASCGRDLIAKTGRGTINRLDSEGRHLAVLAEGVDANDIGCAPDGTWYAARRDGLPGIFRCGPGGCSRLIDAEAWTLAVSPNGQRLAFTRAAPIGMTVSVMGARGGAATEVAVADVPCSIGWASDHALWVPKRSGATFLWVEVDVESRAPTGRTQPGGYDCADGSGDPQSPVDKDLRIVFRSTSEIRAIPLKMLGL